MSRTIIRAAALLLVALLLLTGCSGKDAAPEATEEPQTNLEIGINGGTITHVPTNAPTAEPTWNPMPEVQDTYAGQDAPAEAETQAASEAEAPAAQQQVQTAGGLMTVSGTAFGFSVNYPSGWINMPGRFTICYKENVPEGEVPARFAVTKKTLAHEPKASRLQAQFESYGNIIKAQYDPETFEWEDEVETTFLTKPALEITYLAYIGKTEIKGYMVCTNIEKNVYIYHFYCPLDRYEELRDIRLAVRDSIVVPMPEK